MADASDGGFVARLACFLTLATAVACGSSSDGGGTIAITDYGAQSDRQQCDYLVNCGLAPDRAACAATPAQATDGHALSLVAAVERGTIAYDGKAAYACLQAFWPAADCTQMLVRPEPCTRVFQGQVGAGGGCVLSEECADGGTCSQPGCTASCCAGTCLAGTPPLSLGASCSGSPTACVDGTSCHGGLCSAGLPVGAFCLSPAACGKSSACEIGSNGISGVCARMAEEGEACDISRQFPCRRADDYCDVATGKCAKAKNPGEACASSPCLKYAACVDGECVALPTAGQPCLNQACLLSLLCSSGVCGPRTTDPVCVPP